MSLAHSFPTRDRLSALDELAGLGWEINANQYRAVHLAARYDEEMDWFYQGLKSAALGISRQLQIHSSTASEWIRVGHLLRHLPLIDAAFADNKISYAKTRVLTRWADDDNEQQLLDLAEDRTANRLTTATAKALAVNETDEDRDQRHRQDSSLSSYTDGGGMIIIRLALPPAIGKPVLAVVDELVREIAQTPVDLPANGPDLQSVTATADTADTNSGRESSADGSHTLSVNTQVAPITNSGQESRSPAFDLLTIDRSRTIINR